MPHAEQLLCLDRMRHHSHAEGVRVKRLKPSRRARALTRLWSWMIWRFKCWRLLITFFRSVGINAWLSNLSRFSSVMPLNSRTRFNYPIHGAQMSKEGNQSVSSNNGFSLRCWSVRKQILAESPFHTLYRMSPVLCNSRLEYRSRRNDHSVRWIRPSRLELISNAQGKLPFLCKIYSMIILNLSSTAIAVSRRRGTILRMWSLIRSPSGSEPMAKF